jgi:hypothetical protein
MPFTLSALTRVVLALMPLHVSAPKARLTPLVFYKNIYK